MTFVVRTEPAAAESLTAVRKNLQQVDPQQPLFAITTMEATMARSMAEHRFSVVLMTIFAGLTLVLSALGVYGMLAQRVAGRSRELGVRLALGAVPAQVFGLVIKEGAQLVAAGILLGIAVVALGARLIKESLFGVTPSDPMTYVIIIAALGLTTLVASAVPATVASRTDPVRILRGE